MTVAETKTIRPRSVWSRFWAALRQWRFPQALRIKPPEASADLDALVQTVRSAVEAAGADGGNGSEPALSERDLAGIATGLWRARRRMLQPGTDRPRSEVRQAFRHVQSTWDALAAAEVVVQDHDGERYGTGLALEVLAFQPDDDLTAEQVLETVRPSVYFRGRTLQVGQVIVGTPGADGHEPEGNEAEEGGRAELPADGSGSNEPDATGGEQ